MKNESLFGLLLSMLGKYSIEALSVSADDGDTHNRVPVSRFLGAWVKFFLVLIAILFFVGGEAVKIVFRKDFGYKSLNLFKIILASISFLGIALISFSVPIENEEMKNIFGAYSFWLASAFYIFMSFFILLRGISQRKKAKNNLPDSFYEGDSYVLGFLGKDGWSQKKIQNLAEPLLCISIGFFCSPVNPFLGVPIIFCGLSVWFYQLLELKWGLNPVKTTLEEKGYSSSSIGDFSEVKF